MQKIVQNLYYKSCFEELRVLKPGNHSLFSKILGMNHLKFENAAKISGEIFSNCSLGIGEKIYKASIKCFNQLGGNYNLGIILLCAPIFQIPRNKIHNFKDELKKIISEINEDQGDLIIKAINYVKPAGINNYQGPGDVKKKKQLNFSKIMHIGSRWDRISKCYCNNYNEVLNEGLILFESSKKKLTYKDAILHLYLYFLAKDRDSNIYRKFGSSTADKIMFKAKKLQKKFRSTRKFKNDLEDFDKYLKYFHYNPGTCADLTVTTLLISKIRDIFNFKI